MYSIDALTTDLAEIPWTTDATIVRRKSRDHFVISPLLRGELAGNLADIVISPRTKAEVARVIAAAVKHRVPVTPRGGGTANYGQSVPSHGGILLDMVEYRQIISIGDGVIRAEAGANMLAMDIAARETGWEMRLHPSTIATSTIAGFIAGGSGGIGSAMWGMLRDRGNIAAIEVMSAEETPRLIELTGDDLELVHHAYGANAIITEVAMPLAPAWPWRECIVAFADFSAALKFGVQLARETGIVKKLASVHEWPIPKLMRELHGVVPEGHSMVECYVAAPCFAAFQSMIVEFGGDIVSNTAPGENPFGAPLYEFAYGHGLRQLQKTNPVYTGLQGLFRGGNLFDSIAAVRAAVSRDEPFRLEIFWSDGDVVAMGSPVIAFQDGAQMAAMVSLIQKCGGVVANSHVTGVREVGIKRITSRDVDFKAEMDPYGLLNPGKLNLEGIKTSELDTTGWRFRARA
jgi:FAD/FMN-containing dehydrogenase